MTTSPDLQRQVTAHEVRALSASWAAYKGVALGDVLEVATWCNHSMFSQFYLRDCSVLADGMRSIGPVVAAQHVVRGVGGDLPFLGLFPFIRPFLFSPWWPHLSPLKIEEGPAPSRSFRPSVSPVPLPQAGCLIEIKGREPSPYFGSLVTLLCDGFPTVFTIPRADWSPSGLSMITVPRSQAFVC
jgi:hypothetical protein